MSITSPRRESIVSIRAAVTALALLIATKSLLFEAEQPRGYNELRNEAQQSHQKRHRDAIQERGKGNPHPLLLGSLLASSAPSSEGITRGTVYVPAYSSIRAAAGYSRIDLATTLSIRNTSKEGGLVLEHVDYHDNEGSPVRRYLEQPIAIKPLGGIEMFALGDHPRGGAGASFVVHWSAAEPIPGPLVEVVMIGSLGTTSYSFVSRGRAIERQQGDRRLLRDPQLR